MAATTRTVKTTVRTVVELDKDEFIAALAAGLGFDHKDNSIVIELGISPQDLLRSAKVTVTTETITEEPI